MDEHERGQVAASAAEVYDEFFVPALFAQWPTRVLTAVGLRPGMRVLDVACGTGALAREAAAVAGSGAVVGLDINDSMLAVARSRSHAVDWQTGDALSLPFDDHSFDRVVSQFGLMFFDDRRQALSEMLRVTRPGGRVGVAVWAALEDTPGYLEVAKLLRDLFGAEVARSIEAPYVLGDTGALKQLFADAGAPGAAVQTMPGQARFSSVESWVHTDIKGWTLADVIDDAGYAQLLREAPARLAGFVLPDGSVKFPAPAHIVTVDL